MESGELNTLERQVRSTARLASSDDWIHLAASLREQAAGETVEPMLTALADAADALAEVAAQNEPTKKGSGS